jgi:hypothetical protein
LGASRNGGLPSEKGSYNSYRHLARKPLADLLMYFSVGKPFGIGRPPCLAVGCSKLESLGVIAAPDPRWWASPGVIVAAVPRGRPRQPMWLAVKGA